MSTGTRAESRIPVLGGAAVVVSGMGEAALESLLKPVFDKEASAWQY
jgi:hypothetical protein